jgi:hypothetical protein
MYYVVDRVAFLRLYVRCVCMYVCMYVESLSVCVYIYIYIYIYIYTHTCICIYTHMKVGYRSICMYTNYIHSSVAFMRWHVTYAHTCMYVCMYVESLCMYTYTHNAGTNVLITYNVYVSCTYTYTFLLPAHKYIHSSVAFICGHVFLVQWSFRHTASAVSSMLCI